MSVKAGSFTPNATGNVSVANLTFLPDELMFSLGARTGSIETTFVLYCRGWTTASNQSYDYFYHDGTRFRAQAGTDKCIRLYWWNTTLGSWEELVAATFVSFDTYSATNFGFTLNFTAVNSSWQVRYIARG